jgi:hypothetical protein
MRGLSDFTVEPASKSGDKLTRFGPFSSQRRAGNVKIRRGPWNEELFRILEGFRDLPMTTKSTPAIYWRIPAQSCYGRYWGDKEGRADGDVGRNWAAEAADF